MYKLWIKQVHKYASDLGEELKEELKQEINDIDYLTIEKIKKLRFKLLGEWMNNAPKKLVLDHLEEIGDSLSARLNELLEEEHKLLLKKDKINLNNYLRNNRFIPWSESDSD